MTSTTTGLAIAAVGAIAALIAVVKFFVIGYYPDELVPYLALGVAGAAAMWFGNKLYIRARQES